MEFFLFALELIGTVAFAISGALTGIKKEMDLLGVIILGLTTAVGGGVLRDLILGLTPPKTFQDPTCALIAMTTSLIVFLVCALRKHTRGQRLLLIMDAIGLGIFTVNGISVAINCSQDYRIMLLLFVGVLTGVGGGVVRDVLAGDRPYIFIKHIYACASVVGALVYLFSKNYIPEIWSICLSIAATVVIRVLSSYFHWNLPKASLSDHVFH